MTRRVYAAAAALALGLLSGCGGEGPEAAAGLSGVVNTNGSTSMEQVAGCLMEAFMARNSGVTINYSGTGSSTGIQGVLDGLCDIGMSSRSLKAEEAEAGAVGHLIALDGIALVVNPENPVEDLTVEEAAGLATGTVTNWSQVGGADRPVAFLGREAGSGTRSAFEESTGTVDRCSYTNELTATGDIIANVSSNPNAIGYVSLSGVSDGVKPLRIGGVAPGEDTLRDGSYAIRRPFYLVTKADAPLPAAAQAFLDYAASGEAAGIIRIAGAVPPAAGDPGGKADAQ